MISPELQRPEEERHLQRRNSNSVHSLPVNSSVSPHRQDLRAHPSVQGHQKPCLRHLKLERCLLSEFSHRKFQGRRSGGQVRRLRMRMRHHNSRQVARCQPPCNRLWLEAPRRLQHRRLAHRHRTDMLRLPARSKPPMPRQLSGSSHLHHKQVNFRARGRPRTRTPQVRLRDKLHRTRTLPHHRNSSSAKHHHHKVALHQEDLDRLNGKPAVQPPCHLRQPQPRHQ